MISCASFSTSSVAVNIFNAEYAVLAVKGHNVKVCYERAMANAARILGETEHWVYIQLPETGKFEGVVSHNGKRIACTVEHSIYSRPIVVQI